MSQPASTPEAATDPAAIAVRGMIRDAKQAEQVARKIVVRAIKAPCGGCSRPLPPDKLHWSPLTDDYLCYIRGAGKRRGPTLREVLQRITKAAAP